MYNKMNSTLAHGGNLKTIHNIHQEDDDTNTCVMAYKWKECQGNRVNIDHCHISFLSLTEWLSAMTFSTGDEHCT